MSWINGKIFVGDVGKKMRFDTKIDLSGYQEINVFIRTPTGDATWTVTASSGETEYGETEGLTVLEHITTVTDYTSAGTYYGISYVKFSDSSVHYGELVKWMVYDRFEPDE